MAELQLPRLFQNNNNGTSNKSASWTDDGYNPSVIISDSLLKKLIEDAYHWKHTDNLAGAKRKMKVEENRRWSWQQQIYHKILTGSVVENYFWIPPKIEKLVSMRDKTYAVEIDNCSIGNNYSNGHKYVKQTTDDSLFRLAVFHQSISPRNICLSFDTDNTEKNK